MEDKIKEGLIKGSIDIISTDKTEIILKQMKECICKINGKKEGTGFFSKITYNNKLIPVLITIYDIIDDDYIKNNKEILIFINEKQKIININKDSKIYSSDNEQYNLMIIKINEDIVNNYLEIDDNIFKDNSEILYKENSIYILHNSINNKVSVSYGYGIEKINEYDIKHICNAELCSSGGPILNLSTNKIIGIHKGLFKKNGINEFNIGTYLKYPLIEMNEIKNEIKMKIKIDKKDINNKIYFLDNTNDYKDENGIKLYHENLKELNKLNVELYINNIKKDYKKYFIPKEEGIYTIKLKFKIFIKDCSFMFFNCNNLIDINLWNFNISHVINMCGMFGECKSLKSISDISSSDSKNVINMSKMFYLCVSLESLPDISNWNTSNVKDMSYMFFSCGLLQSLPDISNWDTTNVKDMSYMFNWCTSLKSLPDISKWETKNVNNMSFMFVQCKSLKSLQDISNWDTQNVNNISNMFAGCQLLESLPDISKWNTTNVNNMSYIFCECKLLKSLPDISKWDTKNVNNMSKMFSQCKSLKSIPDISNWDTKNVNNMSGLFHWCVSLESLPDISKWNTTNVNNMNCIFSDCKSLISLPDISKWDTQNVNNMSGIFADCKSLKSLPDISKWDTKNVNNMSKMFIQCKSLESLPNISKWDIKNVKNMKNMFDGVDKKLVPKEFKKV